VRFNVSGRIQLSDDSEDVAHAAGSLRQRLAKGSPLPQNYAGALIAKVGDSAPFPIGNNTAPVTMPSAGQLYLGINDDEVSDNRGEYLSRWRRYRRGDADGPQVLNVTRDGGSVVCPQRNSGRRFRWHIVVLNMRKVRRAFGFTSR
jgi:hypothetical protein